LADREFDCGGDTSLEHFAVREKLEHTLVAFAHYFYFVTTHGDAATDASFYDLGFIEPLM